jgi:uncharacterized membrane protein
MDNELIFRRKRREIMLRAADYRERARASLSGNWGMAVLVCFVGALLGGIQSVIPVTANYQYGEGMSVQIFGINMSLNQLPAEMLGILAVMMSILSIYALAQFVIGGVVELGMCAYFSKRALGENADIKDEFAYFQYFGKALGLRIVTSIFIFLWTMLFIKRLQGCQHQSIGHFLKSRVGRTVLCFKIFIHKIVENKIFARKMQIFHIGGRKFWKQCDQCTIVDRTDGKGSIKLYFCLQ